MRGLVLNITPDLIAACAHNKSATAEYDAKFALNKRDFEARFDIARWHRGYQQWTAAPSELLDILMRDKTWAKDGP